MKNQEPRTKNQNRKLKKVLLAFSCSMLLTLGSFSQDIHFTQFYTTPLALNPANTGYYDGNYRVGFNFKAQWPWAIQGIVYNYHTESPYIDFSFGEKKLKSGWMGAGFNFVNDEAGDGRLTYRRFSLSYAYHQAFDKEHKYVLSAGAALGYIIRKVDFSKFYFNNQWLEDEGFSTNIPSNEPLKRETFSMLDVSAGLNFGAQVHEKIKLDFGFCMLHINRPKHSFLNNGERIGFRYQANGNITVKITDRFSVAANAYYGYEKKASEIMVGALFGYAVLSKNRYTPEHSFYLGSYYRIKDALAPTFGYGFRNTRLLLSYDVTLSKLVTAARANGGPEISLVHVGSWKLHYRGKKVYCPRF